MSIKDTTQNNKIDNSKLSFITTPIFYANGEPHLGHAYTGIIADIFSRFSILSGNNNHLITGKNEHGQKIASTAQSFNKPIQEFLDSVSQTFQELWPHLEVEPNIFIRTTSGDHKNNIKEIWKILVEQGDIYLGSYSGDYCLACEQYYPERELIDSKICPIHKRPINRIEEETYLFQLEKYRLKLLDYYETHPDVIVPRHFQDKIIAQLKSNKFEDLSVSRINKKWGIEVPDDTKHTVYVWIDALFSYIKAINRTGSNRSAISETQHVIGKDILIFHAIYWPAFLIALKLPMPEKLIVHGWWTIDG